ncbi:MAG: DNA methylase [Faecalibacterium sp.]
MAAQRTYLAIDLKSFYASVECVDRHLDPLTTNLVVADASRTEKTICLAVSPSLKAYKIPGRARLFEAVQRVREVNAQRLQTAIQQHKAVRGEDGKYRFASTSFDANALNADPALGLSYIVAPPRMQRYLDVSTQIYKTYLKYVSSADIYPYSIDEVFIDVTGYLPYYHMSAHELAMTMVREVLYNTGITATAGIGTNLYLAKLAMDIVAKHIPADKDGVRIAELDEQSYRYLLWNHRPLTDFWMTGPGTVKRLEAHGIYTMGDLARFSIHGEDRLYEIFGVDAEILIDHAWGYEPCGMEQIKSYKPSTNSISEGQVLSTPYPYDKAKLIVREMAEILMFRLTEKKLVAESITLEVGYDRENVDKGGYRGLTQTDRYGRIIPKAAHGTVRFDAPTNLGSTIINESAMRRSVVTAQEVRMENYKNSKIGQETAQKYGDILEMERPQTEESLHKHPRMTLQNRAKIFSPFAALRGYDEQLAAEKQRTERVTKRILTEEEMSALSDRLMQVTKGMTITVRYFKEDTAHPEIPAVGNYVTLTGKADRIDPVFRTLQVGDTVVPFEDLVEVSGEGIMEIDQYLGISEE